MRNKAEAHVKSPRRLQRMMVGATLTMRMALMLLAPGAPVVARASGRRVCERAAAIAVGAAVEFAPAFA